MLYCEFILTLGLTFCVMLAISFRVETRNVAPDGRKCQTTKPRQNGSKLWMDSVMFEDVLRWERINSSKYTVYVKHRFADSTDDWSNSVEWCTNISTTYCDVTNDIRPHLTYDITVKSDANQETISFQAEKETVLLPPQYQVLRKHDVIFIGPIKSNLTSKAMDYLSSLYYQVKYWPQKNRTFDNVTYQTFHFRQSKLGLNNLQPNLFYCLTVRLFGARCSDWGQVVCLNKTEKTEKGLLSSANVVLVCSVIAIVLIVGGVFVFKLCFWYKQIKKENGQLPEYLIFVKQEMEGSDYNCNRMTATYEEADRLDEARSYVNLDPTSTIQSFPVANIQSKTFIEKSPAMDTEHEMSADWTNYNDVVIDLPETSNHDESGVQRSRLRSRSRGYYSFSSDDDTCDVSKGSRQEPNVNVDYANASVIMTSLLNQTEASESGVPAYENDCVAADTGYLSMDSWHAGATIFSFHAQGHPTRDSLPFAGFQQNITYCSHTYGDIPDALFQP